jgi:hypothetical protein
VNLTETEKVGLVAFLEMLTDDAFLTDPKSSDPFLWDLRVKIGQDYSGSVRINLTSVSISIID